ncbi:MAG: hypothetical protein NTZ25_04750 [Candidatus Peregrinibacteria bacterium]|nr:hypothetical protein [Candidatus Peregrinibacteria bacterium]
MELNQLPEGYDAEKLGPQKRQTEFDSPESKLVSDAKNLIEIARIQLEQTGVKVDPIVFARRKDNDIEALRSAIAKEQGAEKAVVAEVGQAAKAVVAPTESVEVDPRLKTFKADFDADPTLKSKISWAYIQTRLLANEGHYLALAQAMEQGGQLFGVDAQGRPLISDRGDEPVMKGMNYKNTRDRVLYKHDKNDMTGKLISGEDGKRQSTGYEMFPYTEPYDKSEEIQQYESHTGKHFVQSPDKSEWRSSWLESEENPSLPRDVFFDPNNQGSLVCDDLQYGEVDSRGVRRLLRVEKA